MRKDELISSVQKLILKQSVTQDSIKFVHPKVVEGEIAKAYSTLMKTYYADPRNLMDAELDFFAKKYTKEVKTDSDGFYYVDLPVRLVQLTANLGLRSVKPKGGTQSFVRTTEGFMETIRKLPAYCCLKDAYYYLDGNKIVLDFPMAEHAMVEEVYIKVLPLFEEFSDSDNIEFPGGDANAMNIILQTMGFRPTDNVNDDVR